MAWRVSCCQGVGQQEGVGRSNPLFFCLCAEGSRHLADGPREVAQAKDLTGHGPMQTRWRRRGALVGHRAYSERAKHGWLARRQSWATSRSGSGSSAGALRVPAATVKRRRHCQISREQHEGGVSARRLLVSVQVRPLRRRGPSHRPWHLAAALDGGGPRLRSQRGGGDTANPALCPQRLRGSFGV